jgi:putative glutamine transport system substrate-binding protein
MRLSVLLILLLLAGCGSSDDEYIPAMSPHTGDSWADVLQNGGGTLTAVYVPAEGFAYRDTNGNLTGVTIDLLHEFTAFAQRIYDVNVELRFVEETNWRTFYHDVAASDDGVIGMGNVTITDIRRSELRFSLPYMTNIASLITHEDAPEIADLRDLGQIWTGRTALAFDGTLHEERLRALVENFYPDAQVDLAQSNDAIIELLSEADRYFAYIDLYNYWRAVDRGAPLRRHPAGDEAAEQFGYILSLSTTWGEPLDAWFNAGSGLLETSRYREIMESHLGVELAQTLMKAAE